MVIGVTGGIASGKSSFTQSLKSKGAIAFSADEAARAVLLPSGAVMRSLKEAFGARVFLNDMSLDREWLAKKTFSDFSARETLEGITHPAILRLLRAQLEATQVDFPPHCIAVAEIPLLYEKNLTEWFDLVVVVSSSESARIERLKLRNSLDETSARARFAAQWPLERKIALADIVIANDGDLEALREKATKFWKALTPLSGRSLNAAEKKFLRSL